MYSNVLHQSFVSCCDVAKRRVLFRVGKFVLLRVEFPLVKLQSR